MKDSDMASWKEGTDQTRYDKGCNASFDFKVTLSTRQENTSYDLIKDYNVVSSEVMDTAINSAYTDTNEGRIFCANTTEIGIGIALVIVFYICIGAFCVYCEIKNIRMVNNLIDKLKVEDDESTFNDDKNEAGYVKSPATTNQDTPITKRGSVDDETNGFQEEIEIDVDIEQQA